MRKGKDNLVHGVGNRLRRVRLYLNSSAREMARLLGVQLSSYYKNEKGATTPDMVSLHRLQSEYKISLDWLLFNKGTMFFQERHTGNDKEMEELLKAMSADAVLRHKILMHYFEYKNSKTNDQNQGLSYSYRSGKLCARLVPG